MEAWNSSDLNKILTNVFLNLRIVLCNILRGNGGNDQVEEYRGVKHRKVKIENVIRELEQGGDLVNDNLSVNYNEFNAVDNEGELLLEKSQCVTFVL